MRLTLATIVMLGGLQGPVSADGGQPASGDRVPPAKLMYAGPEQIKDAGVGQFQFAKHEKGALLHVASHNTNLRAKARVKSKVVATLPMATRVEVLKVASGPASVIGKVDRWYEVRVVDGLAKGKRGYLFGMLLTPAAWRVDLDGDGEEEIVTAAFASNFEIRIRIRELEVDDPDSVSLDVKSAGGAYLGQQGGNAQVSIVPAAKAGVALVQVFAHVEACADFATRWVSYTVPGGKPGVLGEAKLAMTQSGISDSPVHSDYEVTFNPAKRTAVVVQTSGEDDENGESQNTLETTRYLLKDGVYVKQPERRP